MTSGVWGTKVKGVHWIAKLTLPGNPLQTWSQSLCPENALLCPSPTAWVGVLQGAGAPGICWDHGAGAMAAIPGNKELCDTALHREDQKGSEVSHA